MPPPTNTLLIEGSFEELSEEFAQYVDDVSKRHNPDASTPIKPEVTTLVSQGKKDDALKKLVTGSSVLNNAPEREFIAAYNLLVHLVLQSPQSNIFLPRMIQNLSNPITSSPQNGPALALSVLTTIFNILPEDNDARYHIFLAIIKVARPVGGFDNLRPQLKQIDSWIKLWDIDEEDQRNLFLQISDAAAEAGDTDESYHYLLRALKTVPPSEASNDSSRDLAVRALKAALAHPNQFAFADLIDSDAIQALRKNDSEWYDLLEIFNAEQLDDYQDFLESHDGFVEKNSLDEALLLRKMRLLTLASQAASTPSRSLPYSHIARALQIPSEDVEMWVIDVIRAGLVEGKLSQLNQTFQVHRSTYRVFGDKQWTEVAGRLDTWKASLEGVLGVIRAEKVKMLSEKEREAKEMESKANGTIDGGRYNRRGVVGGFDD